MEKYITPRKERSSSTYQSDGQRYGDWVCFNCNNLNFSFRKKCNRCKTQTRQQNDLTPTYPYYYYIQPQNQHQGPDPYKARQPLSNQCMNISASVWTPHERQTADRNQKSDLPSVSPILKKYKQARNSEKLTMPTSDCKNSQDYFIHDDCFWKQIGISFDLKDGEKCFQMDSSVNNEEQQDFESQEWDQEIEKLIGRIMF